MCYDDLDPEGPSEADVERFDDESVVCPECGAELWDQAEMCPNCGRFLNDSTHSGMPKWALVVVVLVLIAFVLVFVL